MRVTIAALVAFIGIAEVRAETVYVKYRGQVDLLHPKAAFHCQDTQSSLVFRVCYSPPTQYMIINLRGTYYHYCGIDRKSVDGLLAASSLGQHYNRNIKGRFDCRLAPVPDFSPRGN